MKQRYTQIFIPAAMFVVLLGVLPASVRAQVQHCADGMRPIADGRLQRAIDQLKTKNPTLEFQADERPCQHAKDTISALSATVGRDYLTRLSGYDFVKIVNGDAYFTIERFESRVPADLTKLDAALKRRNPRKLAIEANTSYDLFVVGQSLVLMSSSGVGYDANTKLFHQLQETF